MAVLAIYSDNKKGFLATQSNASDDALLETSKNEGGTESFFIIYYSMIHTASTVSYCSVVGALSLFDSVNLSGKPFRQYEMTRITQGR